MNLLSNSTLQVPAPVRICVKPVLYKYLGDILIISYNANEMSSLLMPNSIIHFHKIDVGIVMFKK